MCHAGGLKSRCVPIQNNEYLVVEVERCEHYMALGPSGKKSGTRYLLENSPCSLCHGLVFFGINRIMSNNTVTTITRSKAHG